RLSQMTIKVNGQVDLLRGRCSNCTLLARNEGLKEWLERETKRVQEESASYWGQATGQDLLYRTKEKLEAFLIDEEAPSFLSFELVDSETQFLNFLRFVSSDGFPLYQRLQELDKKLFPKGTLTKFDPQEIFSSLMIKSIPWEALPPTENI